jgi:hypothetical protein
MNQISINGIDPEKARERAEIAEQVAEYERTHGPVQTAGIHERDGRHHTVYTDHDKGRARSNKAVRHGKSG